MQDKPKNSMMEEIKWNPKVKLVLADVDETVADIYMNASPEMIKELERVLLDGVSIFFVTGGGGKRVQERITNHIKSELRKHILVAHCSGAEVYGFDKSGEPRDPIYSVYEEQMDTDKKLLWRKVVQQIVHEFKLHIYPAMPVVEFKNKAMDDPLAVMMDDRGPQITFEFVNGFDLTPEQAKVLNLVNPEVSMESYDLRIPVLERAEKLFKENNLPVSAKLGGIFALDFPVGGVSKEHAVKAILENDEVLESLRIKKSQLEDPDSLEIWGDKFSATRGGTDRHMSLAVNPKVRAIDFRQEDPAEFPQGYNILLWDGKEQLHNGLLEYLQRRNK